MANFAAFRTPLIATLLTTTFACGQDVQEDRPADHNDGAVVDDGALPDTHNPGEGGASTSTPQVIELQFATQQRIFNLHFAGPYQSAWCDAEGKPLFKASLGAGTLSTNRDAWSLVPCSGKVVANEPAVGAGSTCLTVASRDDESGSTWMRTCDGQLDVTELRVKVSPLPYHTRTGSERCWTLRLQDSSIPPFALIPANAFPQAKSIAVSCDGLAHGLVTQGTYAAYLDGERPIGGVRRDPAKPDSPSSRRIASLGTLLFSGSNPNSIDLPTIDEGFVDFAGQIDLGGGVDSTCDSTGKSRVSLWVSDQILPVCKGRFAGKIPRGEQEASLVVELPKSLSRLYFPSPVSGPNLSAELSLPVKQIRVPIETLESTIGLKVFANQDLVSMSWSTADDILPLGEVLVALIPRNANSGSLFARGVLLADFNKQPEARVVDPFQMKPVDVVATMGGRPPSNVQCSQLALADRDAHGKMEADGQCHLRTIVNERASEIFRPIVINSANGAMYSTGKLSPVANKLVVQTEVQSPETTREVSLRSLLSGQEIPVGTSYEIALVPIDPQQTRGISVRSMDEQLALYRRMPLVLNGDSTPTIRANLPPWTYQASIRLVSTAYAIQFGRVTFSIH